MNNKIKFDVGLLKSALQKVEPISLKLAYNNVDSAKTDVNNPSNNIIADDNAPMWWLLLSSLFIIVVAFLIISYYLIFVYNDNNTIDYYEDHEQF